MRILLSGANGFTGRHLIHALADAGHEVAALRSDLRDREAVQQEVLSIRPESAVHLAALSNVQHEDERAFYDVNVFGALNFVDALVRSGHCERTLIASTGNLYGASAGPARESDLPAPVNHYGASKLAMECMVRARAHDMHLIITRPFNYTGVGQSTAFVIPKLVEHFRERKPSVRLGNLDVEREYNDVRDVCKAYVALLRLDASGTFNVCSGVTYTLTDILSRLRRLTGHDLLVSVDENLVRKNDIRKLSGDPSKLRSAIGPLTPTPIDNTLGWMLAGNEYT